MRLFTKIFLLGVLVFSLAFSASGYFLLRFSLESSLAREEDFALKQYQYDKFTVESAVLTVSDSTVDFSVEVESAPEDRKSFIIWQTFSEELSTEEGYEDSSFFEALAAELSMPAAFLAEDKTLLYSEIEGLDTSFLENLSEDVHTWQFWESGETCSILVGSILRPDSLPAAVTASGQPVLQTEAAGRPVYFVTQWDISKTLGQQETMRRYFVRCYWIAMAAGMAVLMLLSALLTGSLNRMSKAARRIADGDYRERLSLSGRDEIGILAESFNQMADAVEGKIEELEKAAEAKEDFVANFAHELKTPLTSIIGYADTIYQKELSREETRRASLHIWNEGMRLEALSLKLMDLTVMGKQDFTLTELPAEELLQDVAEGLAPLLSEKQIEFRLQAESAFVCADYDLLKTLLLNLTDNSIKAGSSRIELSGRVREGKYLISVRDNGCGMEEEELSRITEAFYMVDKARSRKQHGAGLGLALADRVAEIHGDRLHFESRKGAGTTVSFSLDSRGV
ncbi:MAG: HAMP domain-containing histidine kinase [Butyrivibrio sp.]|nr:HAMP domain-containing histidine kinase [Acetatifactor muris]MCM1560762.1 HAMP domain-containing histidine kinase [Butyrivibrio sp.]